MFGVGQFTFSCQACQRHVSAKEIVRGSQLQTVKQTQIWGNFTMSSFNTDVPACAKSWVKPQLVKIGKIGDVAGSLNVNNNGTSVQLKS